MKKGNCITKWILVLCAMAVYTISNGSHLLGTEISYKHVSGKKYLVEVSLYRSCNECKLGNKGGGSNNVQCDDLKEVYLAVSGLGNCTRKNLGKIDVEHVSFENITPVCNGVRTACDPNPEVSFGIEKHVYEGEIDFDDYLEYKGCGFEFFLLISNGRSQSTNIDGEQNLYNFAYLNPWIGDNSSVQYQGLPPIFSSCNEPYSNSIGGTSFDNDEVSYQIVPPKTGVSSNLKYANSFSAIRPVSVWCDDDPTCKPDPGASPPIGFYFNSTTADLVFTPTNCGEGSFLAVEAKEYREIEGVKKLIGITRRDIQLLVQDPYNNHHPKILEKEKVVVCAGQSFEKAIQIKDQAYQYSDGSFQKSDTIQISWTSNLPNGSVKMISIPEAPYYQLVVNMNPSANDVGNEYFLQIDARDQFCPVPGASKKTLTFVVEQSPVVEISSQHGFCNQIEITTGNEHTYVELINGKDSTNLGQGKVFSSTLDFDKHYQMLATLTASNGCKSTAAIFDKINSNSLVEWDLDTLCEHAPFDITAKSNFSISDIKWQYGKTEGQSVSNIVGRASGDEINAEVTLVQDQESCVVKQTITLPIIRLPEIVVNIPEVICANESPFALDRLKAEPSGNWTYQGEGKLTNDTVVWNPYYISNHELEYTITDSTERCSDSRVFEISPVESPFLELKDLSVCKNYAALALANFFDGNFDLSTSQLKWTFVGDKETHMFNGSGSLMIPAVLDDEYEVSLLATNQNGCASSKSAQLSIIEELVIEHQEVTELCVNDKIDLSEQFQPQPPTGFWLSLNGTDIKDNRFLLNAPCSNIELSYSIDEFGCFAEKSFLIRPLCMTEMSLELPSKMCENEEIILLDDPQLKNQDWTIDGELVSQFDPASYVDQETVTLNLLNQSDNGCTFNTSFEIKIEPLPSFTWVDNESGFCTGDSLELSFQSTADPLFNSSCPDGTSYESGSVKFTSQCEEKIDIEVLVVGDVCQDFVKTYPYVVYPKNKLNLPKFNFGCIYEPLQIDLKKGIVGNFAEVNWILKDADMQNVLSGSTPMIMTDFSKEGVYHLEVNMISNFNCSNTAHVDSILFVKKSPKSNFEPNLKIVNILNPVVEFINTSEYDSGDVNFLWEFGLNGRLGSAIEKNPVFTFPESEGIYPVTLIAKNEWCENIHLDTITVVSGAQVYIPNAFSPWGKGPEVNRTFGVSGSNIKRVKVTVFNRWGQTMFHSEDIGMRWDGTTKNGVACQPGIYIYNVEVYDHQGQKYEYAGPINLLR